MSRALDGMGAVAIGTLLVVIAVFLSYKMASMLIGESALPEENALILAALTEQVGIESVIHMRTLHTGPDEFLVAAKVAVDPTRPLPGSQTSSTSPSKDP